MSQKRFFCVILTLVLVVLLVFTGCPTSSGTDTSTGQQPETGSSGGGPTTTYRPPKTLEVTGSTSTADVNNQLNSFTTATLILSSSSGTATISIPSAESLAVPSGKTLQIGNNVTLEVESGGTAAITGTVSVVAGGTLEVADGGEVTIAGNVNVQSGGTVDLTPLAFSGNDDAITITGTLTVESGGIFHAPPDQVVPEGNNPAPQIAYAGGGKVVLKEGSLGYIGNTLFIAPDSTGSPRFEWEAGTGGLLEFGEDLITLTSGKVKTSQNGAGVRKAVIGPGAELDVGHIFGVQYLLTINGTLTGSGTIAGLNLNVSTITFGPNATISSIPANFYQSDTTTAETNAADMQGKTYVWSSGNKWIANP